ncbi:MAG: hypothetical protein ABSC37_05440 [Xanthobacteraceae bacterium]
MLDAAKYAQHFPDENREPETPRAKPVSAAYAMRPSLLAALSKLEREFREILQAQRSEHADRSE